MEGNSSLAETTGVPGAGASPPARQLTLSRSVAIYEDVVPHYRVGIFEALAERIGEYTLYAEHFDAHPAGVNCVPCAGIGVGKIRLHLRPLLDAVRREHGILICEGRLKLITSTLLAFAGGALGIRVLWWSPIWRPNGRVEIGGGLRGWLMRSVFRRLYGYVTYGRRAAEVALAGGIAKDRIFVAYNSLDTPRLLAAERRWRESPGRLARFRDETGLSNKKVVLYVGQFIPRKRLDVLLDAFAMIRRGDPHDETRLVLIGDGPDLSRVRARADARDLQGSVRFVGRVVDIEQICPYFLSTRVVVLPGAGGLVVNQSLTHGVPVIVGGGDGTESDSVEEGGNGYFWAGDSADSLADLIRRIAYAPESDWQRLSENARAAVKERTNLATMLDGMVRAVSSAQEGPADVRASLR